METRKKTIQKLQQLYDTLKSSLLRKKIADKILILNLIIMIKKELLERIEVLEKKILSIELQINKSDPYWTTNTT